MSNLESLEEAKKTIANMIAARKRLDKYSAESFKLGTTVTQKKMARLSDARYQASRQLEELEDDLHAIMIDANLLGIRPKKPELYETQQVNVPCGLGHSNTVKYTPRKPKSVQEQ